MNSGRAQAAGPGAAQDVPASAEPDTSPAGAAAGVTVGGRSAGLRGRRARPAGRHLLLLACYIGAGVAVTWPMTSMLTGGTLMRNGDISSYVWALWWVSHSVAHLSDPWFTQYMAAPVGIDLGFDTLMPLPGLIMTPVTLLFSAAASFAVLTIVMPGVLCYAAYRAARLWLGQPGSIAAGALFGLSTMVAWQNWYHLNISIGTIFLPLALEAAIRLRRNPGRRQGIILGLVLGASVLTNQESAVLAVLLTAAILVPWLIGLIARLSLRVARPQLRTLALGAAVAVVVASPQLIAMILQVVHGGTRLPAATISQLTQSYHDFGVGLPTLFAPSPRLGHFHLGQLASAYQYTDPAQHLEGVPTFGVVLAGLAVAGLALNWRRLGWLGLMWLAGAALALGPTLIIGTRIFTPLATSWHGVTVSQVMPYSWLIRIPGMSALREADRLALLGLLGAAILAGAAIQWIVRHARPIVAGVAVVVIGAGAFLEAGWTARGATMPMSMPSVDAPIAADPTGSIVVDMPFGLRGGVNVQGFRMPAQALILATADGHWRAGSYTSWVPQPTVTGMNGIVFYRLLLNGAQGGKRYPGPMHVFARQSARKANIGWVIVWHRAHRSARISLIKYLYATGFCIAYQVQSGGDGVTVWGRREQGRCGP